MIGLEIDGPLGLAPEARLRDRFLGSPRPTGLRPELAIAIAAVVEELGEPSDGDRNAIDRIRAHEGFSRRIEEQKLARRDLDSINSPAHAPWYAYPVVKICARCHEVSP